MHDPLTLAWEIKYPWYNTTMKVKYRSSFITVWHVDPEKDGTDDSCGWHSPRITDKQQEKIKQVLSFCVGDHSLFDRNGYHLLVTPEQATYYAFLLIRQMVFGKIGALSLKELDTILSISYNPHDNLRPPAHDGLVRADIEWWLAAITRTLGRLYRPFWKHPRFHFWHYKINIHPLQEIKRWAFTRCSVCGKRFKYGECGVSPYWNATGPLWFKSEKLAHMRCEGMDNNEN